MVFSDVGRIAGPTIDLARRRYSPIVRNDPRMKCRFDGPIFFKILSPERDRSRRSFHVDRFTPIIKTNIRSIRVFTYDMGIADRAGVLLDYSRNELGEDLRAIVCYSSEVYEPVYPRPDILETIDEETRSRFKYPLLQMLRSPWEWSKLYDPPDDPDYTIHSFGDYTLVQFPLDEEEGIVLTYDRTDRLPKYFVSSCKEIIHDSR